MPAHPTILFPADEPHAAWRAVETALADAGFSIGVMQGPSPRCILQGDFAISKRRNLTRPQQDACHAQAWKRRDGSVVVMIHGDCPPDIVPLFEPVRCAAARLQPEWVSA